MSAKRYRTKPVVIEAVQLLWSTWDEMCEHAGVGRLADNKPEGCYISKEGKPSTDMSDETIGLQIPTLEGIMLGCEGDWVIKVPSGELYPCKDSIFRATYEEV